MILYMIGLAIASTALGIIWSPGAGFLMFGGGIMLLAIVKAWFKILDR